MFATFSVDYDEMFENQVDSFIERKSRHIYQYFSQFRPPLSISDILDSNSILFADEIMDRYFHEIKPDIFISHSHKDFLKVRKFADYLWENFGLISFIDSVFWGYIQDLLAEFENKYGCQEDAVSHVHVFLLASLAKVMDASSGIFFFITPNSLKISNETVITQSSWIYNELEIARLLRRKYSEENLGFDGGQPIFEHFSLENERNEYVLQNILEELPVANGEFMKTWSQQVLEETRSWDTSENDDRAVLALKVLEEMVCLQTSSQ